MNSRLTQDHPPHVAQRRRRDDGPPLAGVASGLGQRSRLRHVRAGASPAVRGPVHGQRHQPQELVRPRDRRRHGAEQEPGAAGAAAAAAERHLGPVQQARHRRRHPPRPDRQHPVGGRAPEGGRAARRRQHGPGARRATSAKRPPSRAWCWAASSRSPATTKRISRWPTARTSPGRTPTRRCRWRSTRRWPSTASSTTRAAGGPLSILDRVKEQAAALKRQVSHADRAKLDEYLTSVREVEKRVERTRADKDRADERAATAAGRRSTMPRPDNGLPEDIREHMRLMCDIIALAFQTDKTRVATLLLCRDLSGLFYPFLDVRTAHHPTSHEDQSDAYERVTRYYVSQLAYLAGRLAAMPEGDTTVLDNSCLMFISNMWSGSQHDSSKVPRAAGRRPGRHARHRPGPRLHGARRRQPQAVQPVPVADEPHGRARPSASATPRRRSPDCDSGLALWRRAARLSLFRRDRRAARRHGFSLRRAALVGQVTAGFPGQFTHLAHQHLLGLGVEEAGAAGIEAARLVAALAEDAGRRQVAEHVVAIGGDPEAGSAPAPFPESVT